MTVKIIPESSVMSMIKTKNTTVTDDVEFLEIREDGDEICLYIEGENSDVNYVSINLTKRQARHMATALLQLIQE
jgi:hypothetical protein